MEPWTFRFLCIVTPASNGEKEYGFSQVAVLVDCYVPERSSTIIENMGSLNHPRRNDREAAEDRTGIPMAQVAMPSLTAVNDSCRLCSPRWQVPTHRQYRPRDQQRVNDFVPSMISHFPDTLRWNMSKLGIPHHHPCSVVHLTKADPPDIWSNSRYTSLQDRMDRCSDDRPYLRKQIGSWYSTDWQRRHRQPRLATGRSSRHSNCSRRSWRRSRIPRRPPQCHYHTARL